MYLCYVSHFNKTYHITGARVFQELEEAVTYMKEVTKDWNEPLDDKCGLPWKPVHWVGSELEMLGHVQKIGYGEDLTVHTQTQEIKVIPKEVQEK